MKFIKLTEIFKNDLKSDELINVNNISHIGRGPKMNHIYFCNNEKEIVVSETVDEIMAKIDKIIS